MCKKLMFSAIIVSLLGLAGGAYAGDLHVATGNTHTVTGAEAYEWVNIEGTLIVPTGTSLTASERSRLNGPGAQIIVNGGSVLFDAYRFDLGQGSDGYIHLNGGTFTITGDLKFPDDLGGVHRIYLNDGVMHCVMIQLISERDAIMYVGDGILRLDDVTPGDAQRDPAEWINQGVLLPVDAGDEILIEYVAPEGAEVRAVVLDPDRASNPSPQNGAENVLLETLLSWQGPTGATYDVYLGTDPWNLLPVATGQSATVYDPPGLLTPSTTYYWKVNSGTHEGYVWRFETLLPFAWTNADPADESWCTPGNWAMHIVPGPDDVAFISPPPSRGPVIGPGCNANVYQIEGPVWESSGEQVMDITGGTLAVEDNWRWSFSDVPGYMPWIPPDIVRGKATINITGSPVITINGIDTDHDYHFRGAELGTGIINICGDPTINVPNGFLRGGDKQDSRYIINMKGGTINCAGIVFGDEGQCDLNLSYGTINVDGDFELSCERGEPAPHHTVNITGGTINVEGTFYAIWGTAGTTIINLDCGTIECGEFAHHKEYTMDIEDGVLIIHGNATTDIQADIAAGYITAFGGTDTVDVTYDLNTDKTTVKAASSTGCTPMPPVCTTPEVDAGDDLQIYPWDQPVIITEGTASDPEGDPLQYRWLERSQVLLDWTAVGENGEAYLDLGTLPPLSLGGHVLTLDVTDGQSTVSGKMILTIVENQPPVADAGDNIQIPSADQAFTVIHGTATDPCDDPLQYRWLEGENVLLDWTDVGTNGDANLALASLLYFSVGNHTLTLEVNDSHLTASDEMILTIENSPPDCQAAPSYQVVEIGLDPIIVVADVADFDGDELSYEWLKDGDVLGSGSVETVHGGNTVPIPDLSVPAGDPCFPVGVHLIELRVSDGINDDVNDFVSVEVSDTCAPSLSPVPSVTILWPPNHKLRPVTIAANAFDNGGGAIDLDVAVQSSEPPDADGDGTTIPDYYIDSVDDESGVIELRLRAERSGKGDGRTYTITITATDASGNQSVAIVEILAPHDKRKK